MAFITKASGKRQKFSTGARRDCPAGKGRYDLISPLFLRRLALVMERGAEHYGDRNWEKGMPLGRFMESAFRHLSQFVEGRRDEDHLGQAAFNIMAAIHTGEAIERGILPRELDNLPNFLPQQPKARRRRRR